jgi:glycosyltransferase involved in cell wall biosynthesis
MKYPKISIVTPSYNQADYLEQTICSVLDQNYPNLEYVVIDGGSTDGSVDIIKKYADKLAYWVSKKDNGQYYAINEGFAHTTGEIMSWINSSDIYYPWTLKTIAEIFENNTEVEWIHGMPTNLSSGVAPQSIQPAAEKNIFDVVNGNYKWIQQESVFWKRTLWNKAGGSLDLSVKYAGDFDLWQKFFQHANLYYVNTILGGFRFHDVRRGGNNDSPYGKEIQELLQKFKSDSGVSNFRRVLTKLLIGKSRSRARLFKKSGILPWYSEYKIFYDFETNKWLARK